MIIMCNQWFLLDCWRFRPIEKKGMFRFQSYQFVWSYELQLRNRVNQPLVGCKYMNTYVYVPNHTTIYNSLIKFISCNVHLLYNKGGLNLKKNKKATPIKILTPCESTLTLRSFRPLIVTFDMFILRLEILV